MKHLDLLGALLVFGGIALGLYFRPRPQPDGSLFGDEMELAPELAPLTVPGGTLSLHGTLRTAAGAPAGDAFLALLRDDDDPAEAEPLYHAYTDEQGRFAFERVTPGTYRALLTHPSAPPRTLMLELPADGIQGELSWELLPPLPALPTLPPLQRASVAGGLQLSSSSSAEAATPLEGFEVVLVPDADTPLLAAASEARTTSAANGEFRLEGLVAASYRVEVLPPWARGGSWPVLARGTCRALADTTSTLTLELQVGAIEGQLQEGAGRPLIGAVVSVTALDALDPVGQPQLWPALATDVDGRFRVQLLPPGRYSVHLRAGSATRDIEVVVESGRCTRMPLGTMDPREGENPPGG